MFAVPAATPVTTPALLIVATAVLLLLQAPPATVFPKLEVARTQRIPAPVVVPMAGLPLIRSALYTVVLNPQLLVTVYLIVSLPAARPVTVTVLMDTDVIVASVVSVRLHTPPVVVLVLVRVAPAQIAAVLPVIEDTVG